MSETLLNALASSGPDNLTIASLTAGIDSYGLGRLFESGKVKRMIGSYVGENKAGAFLYFYAVSTFLNVADLDALGFVMFFIEFRTHVLHW